MERIRRRRKRMIRLGSLAVLVAVILAVIFLFQVRTVAVTGNERHTGPDIASDLSYDFLTRNSLYLMWKYRGGKVPETMPYLSSMEIKLESPSRISLTVTEKELVGYLDKDQNVYFDKDGTVLEISDAVYDDVPVVTGVAVGDVTLYQKLPTESSAQLRTILSLLQLMNYQELTATEIRFSDNMDITVTIGHVEAELGQDEYLEEKIANLRAILDTMGEKAGTLHMENFTGKNEPVTFADSGEPVTEEESETSENKDAAPDGSSDGNDGADAGEGTVTGNMTDGGDAAAGGDTGSSGAGGDTAAGGDGMSDGSGAADGTQDAGAAEAGEGTQEEPASTTFMVFNAYGTLIYDAHVVNGVVVDSTGTPIEGCTVNEDGNVVDAYWNVIDPATGELAQ